MRRGNSQESLSWVYWALNPLWPSLRGRVVFFRRSEGHALFHCVHHFRLTETTLETNPYSHSKQLWSGETTSATIVLVDAYGKRGLSVTRVGPHSLYV